MNSHPVYAIEINDVDYTPRFVPLVESIRVSDRAGLATDSASIVLADPNGSILLPQEGDRMRISLGQSAAEIGEVFSGFVADVISRGSKGGGRQLDVAAKGVDPKSQAREAKGSHLDDATFEQAAKKFAANAGISAVVVAPELASIQRPYWAMQFESFMHWGQRISREIGATFKMQDGKAIFIPSSSAKSASGIVLPTVIASWGVNLLSWSIATTTSRERSSKVRARYYDEKQAKWVDRDVDIDGGSGPTSVDRFTSSSSEIADGRASALKSRAERNGGEGTVTILGTPLARAEAPLALSGARPGVDGDYIIDGVEHLYDKSGAYTSGCEVKRPGADVGKDTRTPNAAGSPVYANTSPTSTGRAAGPV